MKNIPIVILLLISNINVFKTNNTPKFQQNHTQKPNQEQIKMFVEEVYGEYSKMLVFNNKERYSRINLFFEHVEINYQEDIATNKIYPNLLDIPLNNRYNKNLQKDTAISNYYAINLLKYNLNIFTEKQTIYRIGDSNYLLYINPIDNLLAEKYSIEDSPTVTTSSKVEIVAEQPAALKQPPVGYIEVDQTTYTNQQLITDVLINGQCATASDIVSSTGSNYGSVNGIGYFSAEPGTFAFESGIILSSGNALLAEGPETGFEQSQGNNTWLGDADLEAEIGITNSFNASFIQFNFESLTDTISFDFLFASEEYGTFQCQYTDAFAFILTDLNTGVTTNLAIVPDTADVVSVLNVRDEAWNNNCPSVNPAFFDSYYGAGGLPPADNPTNFLGYTLPMTAFANVIPNNLYNIKLVMADHLDSLFDAAVFIEGGSFDLGGGGLGDDVTIVAGNSQCEGTPIMLDTELPGVAHVWYLDGVVIPGETESTLTITEGGVYSVDISYSAICTSSDSVLIEYIPNPTIQSLETLTECDNGTGDVIFNLTNNSANAIGTQDPITVSISYHNSADDAINNENPITNPTTYSGTDGEEIYIRIEDTALGICFTTDMFLLEYSLTINAGEDGDLTICYSDTNVINLFDLITGEDTGGVWAQLAGTGGLFDATAGTFTPALGATNSTFEYTLTTGNPNCPDDTSIATISITTSVDAGENGALNICSTGVATDLFTQLGGTPDTGGAWSPALASGTSLFDPLVDMAGTYIYTVSAVAPCTPESAEVVVTVNPSVDAGEDGVLSICSTGIATDLFEQLGGTPDTGGTWSPALASGTGLFDPSVDLAGTYIYTVSAEAPCTPESAEVVVNVTATPDAGTDGAIILCDISASVDLFTQLGGTPDAGGVWSPTLASGTSIFDPLVDSAGTYTYTIDIAGCDIVMADVDVTVNPAVYAGENGTLDICSSGIVTDLFAQLGGTPDIGGTWSPALASGTGLFDPSVDTSGSYTYTVPAVAPCTPQSAEVVVALDQAPDAGTDGTITLCDTSTSVDLFVQLGGTPDTGGIWSPALASGTGVFDPSVDIAGDYTYTVFGVGACLDANSQAEVAVFIQPVADAPADVTTCGTYILPALNVGNYFSGVEGTGTAYAAGDIIIATTTLYVYAETGTLPNCTSENSFEVIINSVGAVSSPMLTHCDPDNDGFGVFTLTDADTEIVTGTGLEISYYETVTDAENTVNMLASPYYNIVSYQQTIYARAEDPTTGCYDIVLLTLEVRDTPQIIDPTPLVVCDNDSDGYTTFDLSSKEPEILNALDADATNDLDPAQYSVTYYNDMANAVSGTNVIATPNAYFNTVNPEMIFVRVEDATTGCYKVRALMLIVNELPVLVQPAPLSLCDYDNPGDEVEFFILEEANAEILNGQTGLHLSYYSTQLGASNAIENNQIFSPYQNTSNAQTIYVRVEDEVTACVTTITLDLRVTPKPSPLATPEVLEYCDDDNDSFGYFDLESQMPILLNGEPDVAITFYETQTDADSGTNPLSSPYSNIVADIQTIYVRAENTITACYTMVELELEVIPSPVVPLIDDYIICDDNNDGFNVFDFDTVITPQILTGTQTATDYTLTYHTNVADTDSGANPIVNSGNYTNTINPQTIYIRLESNITECVATGMFAIEVGFPPVLDVNYDHDLFQCDDLDVDYMEVNDGFAVFDLTLENAEIVNGNTSWVVTYYESEANAQNNTNAIADPTVYTNTDMGVQTLHVRVTDNDTGCFEFTTVTLNVLPNPSPSPQPEDLIMCEETTGTMLATFNLTDNEAFIINGEGGVAASYYTNQEDAIMGGNAIADPTLYSNEDPNNQAIGLSPQTIYVRVENVGATSIPATGCYSLVSFDLIVNPLPSIPETIEDYVICQLDTSGGGDFNLDTMTDTVLNGQDAMVFDVTYHESQLEAEMGINAINSSYISTSNPQAMFVNITNTETDCATVSSFNLVIEEAAIAYVFTASYELCGENNIATFDLASRNATVLGNQGQQGQGTYAVSYYENQVDADLKTNPLPLTYTNTSNPQVIIARVDNDTMINGVDGSMCYDTTTLVLQVNPPPFFDLEETYILCVNADTTEIINSPIIDTGLDPDLYTFEWSHEGEVLTDETGGSITPTVGGVYTVVVTDIETMCQTTVTTIVITLGNELELTTSVISLGINQNDLQVTVSSIIINTISTYEFSIDDGPWESSDNSTYIFNNVGPGEHNITVRDTSGCGEATVTVMVVGYPLYFTPNGDNTHETWQVYGLSNQPEAKIYIFDRYGKLLKQLDATGEGWNGTYNGNLMPGSDYWFTVEYTDPSDQDQVKSMRGHFALKR